MVRGASTIDPHIQRCQVGRQRREIDRLGDPHRRGPNLGRFVYHRMAFAQRHAGRAEALSDTDPVRHGAGAAQREEP